MDIHLADDRIVPAFTNSLALLMAVVWSIWFYKRHVGSTTQGATSSESRPKQNSPVDKESLPRSNPESITDLTNMDDGELYEKAWNELESETLDKGLWSKLYSKYEVQEEKIKAAYIQVRVEQEKEKQDIAHKKETGWGQPLEFTPGSIKPLSPREKW